MLRPKMKVDFLDPTSKMPCAFGEVCGVVGMTSHESPIAPGNCIVVMTCVKKTSVRLLFPNEGALKMKEMVNDILMWCEKGVAFKWFNFWIIFG
jgi:hypothetical protein